MTVAVVICHIPTRRAMLMCALDSVVHQTRPVDQIVVAVDNEHRGAPHTWRRTFAAVECDYAVGIGDDDWLDPLYVERVLPVAEETGADVTYAGYTVVGGEDPFAYMFGREFTPALLHAGSCIPGGGALVRMSTYRACGGVPVPEDDPDYQPPDPRWPGTTGEDYALWMRMLGHGATFHHVPERLWFWRHHGMGAAGVPGNTSGRGDRW